MINTIKPHYIEIQPLLNKRAIEDENCEILVSPQITSIFDDNDYEVMDHIFYIQSYDELENYELIYDFVDLVFRMTADYIFDEIEFDSIFIKFMDCKTNSPLFGIIVEVNEDGEFDFAVLNLKDEFDCDGDCEHCKYHEEADEGDESNISSYYFGFEW